jgi:hypothetical protein
MQQAMRTSDCSGPLLRFNNPASHTHSDSGIASSVPLPKSTRSRLTSAAARLPARRPYTSEAESADPPRAFRLIFENRGQKGGSFDERRAPSSSAVHAVAGGFTTNPPSQLERNSGKLDGHDVLESSLQSY